jgi:hypothetical protein
MSKRIYKFVFRIRRVYFDQIVFGTKTVEYRSASDFWRKRVLNSNTGEYSKILAVFICGKLKHTRKIEHIKKIKTPGFSEQGQKDVNTPECYAFYLGEVT